jgi:hypothetical protein
VWTGQQFLYVDNTTNRVSVSGPSGSPFRSFASMPRQVEETRCRVPTGGHGFASGDVFCHSPDNKIYRISSDGASVSLFATLPDSSRSDGALTFDTVGAFGYELIAATGRSGGAKVANGNVYSVSSTGTVRRIGGYTAPGGADEVSIAPAGFGAAAGQIMLAVDGGKSGSLIAMNTQGRTTTLFKLPDGPNPIVAIASGNAPPANSAKAGLYVADTLSRTVYFVSNAQLTPYHGDIIVGSELRGQFWLVMARGSTFTAVHLPTDLSGSKYNLEDAVYIAQ